MSSMEWHSVDWEAVTVALRSGSPSSVPIPLLQAALDTADEPVAQLCGSVVGACTAGVFALRGSVLQSLLLQDRITRKKAEELAEPTAAEFASLFGVELGGGRTTLHEEFGEEQQERRQLPHLALQILGRLLYMLGGLPPPPGTSHFTFGDNWQQFVQRGRVSLAGALSAAREVRRALGGAIRGLRVLDLGCGSGLQSLVLRLAGAHVASVDVQPAALQATRQLRKAFGEGNSSGWSVAELSALDAHGLAEREPADVVYAWGVLHHTGDLWQALHNAQLALREDGLLLAALYAEEYYDEKENLLAMKRFYRNASAWRQEQLEIVMGLVWLRPQLRAGRGPFEVLRDFQAMRGMDFWTDVRDWLGGWPMQFASSKDVLSFAKRSGLRCIRARRYGGNTEFQLVRPAGEARWTAGRKCYELGGWKEDGVVLMDAQRFFYHHGETEPSRRWWKSELPEPLRNFSDGPVEPQRDRLLLLGRDGQPFGYPSAQFARPDSLEDPELFFHAFWQAFAYASPPKGGGKAELEGLRACLLPEAELKPEELAEVSARVESGLDALDTLVKEPS